MALLVIGLGSFHRREDAAGLIAARRAGELGGGKIRAVECGEGPIGLLDHWTAAPLAVVLDASSSGAPAGTVRRFDHLESGFEHEAARCSSHGIGLREALALGRATGRLPARWVLQTIEGADFSRSEGLTPEVARAVERIARQWASCQVSPPSSPRGARSERARSNRDPADRQRRLR